MGSSPTGHTFENKFVESNKMNTKIIVEIGNINENYNELIENNNKEFIDFQLTKISSLCVICGNEIHQGKYLKNNILDIFNKRKLIKYYTIIIRRLGSHSLEIFNVSSNSIRYCFYSLSFTGLIQKHPEWDLG